MDRKEEKFMQLLDELVQDESTFPLPKEYMDKVEKLMKLYVEVYVEPIVKGNDKLSKISYNKDAQNVDVKQKMTLGATDAESGNIKINIGLLQDVEPGLNYVERRNKMLFALIGTVSHEARHSFQVIYRKLLEKNNKKDIKKLEFYKKLLGEKAEEIADSTLNGLTNEQLEAYLLIMQITHPDLQDHFNALSDGMKQTSSLYYASLHEQDARQAELEAKSFLLERIMLRAEQRFDACKFPEKFDQMIKTFDGVFTLDTPKKRRGKKDDLSGDLSDVLKGLQKIGKKAGKAKNKIDKQRGSLSDTLLDFTSAFLKQHETFMEGLQSVTDTISNEIILQENQIKVVEEVVDMMKGFSPIELATYAEAVKDDPEKELMFTYALKGLSGNKYTARFFIDEKNLEKTKIFLRNKNLIWACDMLDETFGIDSDSYSEI